MSSEPSSVLCSNSYWHDKNERQENINFTCLAKSQKDNKNKIKNKKQKKRHQRAIARELFQVPLSKKLALQSH